MKRALANIIIIASSLHLCGQDTVVTLINKSAPPKGQDTITLDKGQVSQTLWGIPDYRRPDSPRRFQESYLRALTKQSRTVKPDHGWGASATIVFRVRNLSSAKWWEVHYLCPGGIVELYKVTSTVPFKYSEVTKASQQVNETMYTRYRFTTTISDSSIFILDVTGIDEHVPITIVFQRKVQYPASRRILLYIVCALLAALLSLGIVLIRQTYFEKRSEVI